MRREDRLATASDDRGLHPDGSGGIATVTQPPSQVDGIDHREVSCRLPHAVKHHGVAPVRLVGEPEAERCVECQPVGRIRVCEDRHELAEVHRGCTESQESSRRAA
jgi:hypothetical protein